MAGIPKQRLDLLLIELGLVETLAAAQRLISAGKVLVNDRICDKAGTKVAVQAKIVLKPGRRFVSRGGDKLEAGLEGLGLDPAGWICVDVGASTGGFTDCLLQRGAGRVYCVDVGYGILDWKLRRDPRVVVLERTNARALTQSHIAEPLDLAVIDASFISLEPLLPPLVPLFKTAPRILALVKPQFQLPREMVGPGGIVADAALHRQALLMVERFGQALGLRCAGTFASPVLGTKGNQEFFILLVGSNPTNHVTAHTEHQGERDERI